MQSSYLFEQGAPFRDLVVRACAGERHACDARASWESLVTCSATIVDAFQAGEVAYLVMTAGPQTSALPLRVRKALELALGGLSHKELASELDVAQSTITAMLKCGLARLGLGGLPSKAPLSLFAIAQAATVTGRGSHGLSSTDLFAHGRRYEIVSVAHLSLLDVLPPAVRQVVLLRAEGKTYAEIAAKRSTSTRTVANQLASAFQRLKVSGRKDLVSRLLRAQVPPQCISA